jgi:hypothetical protein
MVYLIPKARMHPVERYSVIGGLVILGLATGLVVYAVNYAAFAPVLISLLATLALVLNPADQLEYRVEAEGLRIGRESVPFASVQDARVVRLDGMVVYRGLVLPGYWSGRAWSPRLGRFEVRGSTGVGQGVLLTLAGGRRLVITPANPVNVTVQLQVTIHQRRAGFSGRMHGASRRNAPL